MKRLLLLLSFLLLLTAGCNEKPRYVQPTHKPTTHVFSINQSADVGRGNLSVLDVERKTTLFSRERAKVKRGQYIIIKALFEGFNGQEAMLRYLDFSLNGKKPLPLHSWDDGTFLGNTMLRNATFLLVFEDPNATLYKLTYFSPYTKLNYTWLFTPSSIHNISEVINANISHITITAGIIPGPKIGIKSVRYNITNMGNVPIIPLLYINSTQPEGAFNKEVSYTMLVMPSSSFRDATGINLPLSSLCLNLTLYDKISGKYLASSTSCVSAPG